MCLAPAACVGSSPLARGLLLTRPRKRGPSRIIPARAGFTNRPPATARRSRDHPRSRGVYRIGVRVGSWRQGSSPLARGLLRHLGHRHGQFRIIPARAGFTSMSPGPGRARKDHPRSRGVYRLHIHRPLPDLGSSPLARGLQSAAWQRIHERGIIPARAGFTALIALAFCWDKDHPRSRGVYCKK